MKPLLFFAVAILFASCASIETDTSRGLVMTPYLQGVSDTSAFVLVECLSSTPVTAEYGVSNSYGMRASTRDVEPTEAGTFVHNIHLGGLAPATRYHYRVASGGGTTVDADFVTAAPPGVPFRFAWMADTRGDTTVHDSIATRVLHEDPAFLLFGGDTGPTSSYASFKSHFFRPPQLAVIARAAFYNATGNHERWGINTKAFTQAPPSASGAEAYYSFDWGDLHVLVLNNEVPYGPGTPQYAFAAADLARNKGAWKIVASHRPAYCGGGHGEDGDMKAMTSDIFERNGVCMVISGHTHLFQHNLVNGIHHMVVGSAGAPLYDPKPAPYTLVSAKSYNFAIFDVSPGTLHMMVYDQRGGILDSLTLHPSAQH